MISEVFYRGKWKRWESVPCDECHELGYVTKPRRVRRPCQSACACTGACHSVRVPCSCENGRVYKRWHGAPKPGEYMEHTGIARATASATKRREVK